MILHLFRNNCCITASTVSPGSTSLKNENALRLHAVTVPQPDQQIMSLSSQFRFIRFSGLAYDTGLSAEFRIFDCSQHHLEFLWSESNTWYIRKNGANCFVPDMMFV